MFGRYGLCCACLWSAQSTQSCGHGKELVTGLALVALQQHSEGQLEGKQNGKWDFGDLGHGRQKRDVVSEEVRAFLMTSCISPSQSYIPLSRMILNPGTKDLVSLFYRPDRGLIRNAHVTIISKEMSWI